MTERIGFIKKHYPRNAVLVTLLTKDGAKEEHLVKVGKPFKTIDGRNLILTDNEEIKEVI
jgi:hypothetical protein